MNKQIQTTLIVIALLALAWWWRQPHIVANLPVAVHPDERGAMSILWRLLTESRNPQFFSYPTLYFYATSAWLHEASVDQILPLGRTLNLAFGCGLGLATGWLTWHTVASRPAALLATALVLFSPELSVNASYLSVDTLFVLLNIVALGLWLHYWETQQQRMWLLAILASGLALATKYNAILVLGSMLLVEWGFGFRSRWPLDAPMPTRWRIGLLVALGLCLSVAGSLISAETIITLANNPTAADLDFAQRWLDLLQFAAAATLALACLVYFTPKRSARFFIPRPYLAILLAVIVFFIATPFALVSWQTFLLDVGIELKKNALSGEQGVAWQYVRWLRQYESIIALAFAPLGLWQIAQHKRRPAALLLAYLFLNLFTILSATRGFERYLTPLLPILYLLATAGMGAWIGWLQPRYRQIAWLLLLVVLSIELLPKMQDVRAQAGLLSNQHAVYTLLVDTWQPENTYVQGFVPGFEVRSTGLSVPRIDPSDPTALAKIGRNDLLVLDRQRHAQIPPSWSARFELIWSSDTQFGVYVLRPIR